MSLKSYKKVEDSRLALQFALLCTPSTFDRNLVIFLHKKSAMEMVPSIYFLKNFKSKYGLFLNPGGNFALLYNNSEFTGYRAISPFTCLSKCDHTILYKETC